MSEIYSGGCSGCPVIWKNFRHLSESELKLIDENRYEAAFKPGEILVKQGTPASNALFLASGIAKKYIEGINGRNFISGILIPGSPLMGPGAYTGARYTCSVSALTQVKACFVSFDVFRKLVRETTFLQRALSGILPCSSEKQARGWSALLRRRWQAGLQNCCCISLTKFSDRTSSEWFCRVRK